VDGRRLDFIGQYREGWQTMEAKTTSRPASIIDYGNDTRIGSRVILVFISRSINYSKAPFFSDLSHFNVYIFFPKKASNNLVALAFASLPALLLLFSPPLSPDQAPLSSVLKALNLCAASTVISAITIVNFSLAACLSIAFGIPLSLSVSSPRSFIVKIGLYAVYAVFSLGWLVFTPHLTSQALWDWDVINVWFAPVLCLVYYPFLIQAGLVALF
jgi:hypothetical protein